MAGTESAGTGLSNETNMAQLDRVILELPAVKVHHFFRIFPEETSPFSDFKSIFQDKYKVSSENTSGQGVKVSVNLQKHKFKNVFFFFHFLGLKESCPP